MALEVFRVTKNCRVGKVKRFPPPDCAKMGILGFQSCLESLPSRIRTQYWRIATTAPTPSWGGERLFNCQMTKRARRHSELAAPLVCEERAIQGRVPFRVFRNRQIEVNKLESRRRKRDFHALAPLRETGHFSQNQRFWKK